MSDRGVAEVEPTTVAHDSKEPPPSDHQRLAGGRGVRWIVAHPWWTLVLYLVVLGACASLLSMGTQLTNPKDSLTGESKEALDLIEKSKFGDRPTETIIISDGTNTATAIPPAALNDIRTSLTGTANVRNVLGPIPVPKHGSQLFTVVLDTPEGADPATKEVATKAKNVTETTQKLREAHPTLRINQLGFASGQAEVESSVTDEFRKAEIISIPVTLAVLLLAFGAVVAAFLPAVVGLGSVAAAMGLTALYSHFSRVDANAPSLILLIGLAVGVDYALFIVHRFRHERKLGTPIDEAICRTMSSTGRAVVISGTTVMVSMVGMLVAGGMFASMGIGTLIVIAFAVFSAVTALPALLTLIGDKVNAWRIKIPGRKQLEKEDASGWARMAERVAKRPWIYAGVSLVVLGALAAPALNMRTVLSQTEFLPPHLEQNQAQAHLEELMPSKASSMTIVVQGPASSGAKVREGLEQAAAATKIEHLIPTPGMKAQTDESGTVTRLILGSDLRQSSEDMPELVRQVRGPLAQDIKDRIGLFDEVSVKVTGAAMQEDFTENVNRKMPWVVGFVLLVTLLVMLISFGSPVLALATVLLNLLSVCASYGILVLVFQGHWAEKILDFHSLGSIASWLPLMLFVILFGLSMDYHVFLTSSIRAARLRGLSPTEAIKAGVAQSASVITGAAAVMVAVFAVFATLNDLGFKQLGLGLAVAIALDATVVRGLLVPAVFTLLGDRIHRGPKWLPTIHP